jgi:hypothetical protein
MTTYKQTSYHRALIFLLIIILIIALINYYSKKEAFTPKINQAYRPYFRRARIHYDTFMNYFTKDNVIVKLKKWNIY